MKLFLDSSAFAKRFIDEPGSDQVENLCAQATSLSLSIVCVPEIISALNRRLREKTLTQRDYRAAKQQLSEDVRDAVIINLTSVVVHSSITVLEHSAVRTLDALHVASAIHWKADLFASSDHRQVLAARRAGLKTKQI